jgi:hypothetical protein
MSMGVTPESTPKYGSEGRKDGSGDYSDSKRRRISSVEMPPSFF